MTQEVINDICARLPHEIFIHYIYRDIRGKEWPTDLNLTHFASDLDSVVEFLEDGDVEDPKPYLRPMSSITEEELKELNDKYGSIAYFFIQEPPYYYGLQAQHSDIGSIEISKFSEIYDWLNASHLDYRGFIPMGLALEAPKDMYKTG